MRDAFAVLFFVSVGMLFDPAFLVHAPLLVLAALAVVLVGKPLVALVLVLVLGLSRAASALGDRRRARADRRVLLHPRGPRRAARSGHRRRRNTLVAAAIVSITVNPLLYRAVEPLERWVRAAAARPTALADAPSRQRPVDRRPAAPRRRDRLRPGRPDGRAAAARERDQADRHRAEHGDRAARCATRASPRSTATPSHRDTLESAGVPTPARSS